MADHSGHSIDCGVLRDWLSQDLLGQSASLEVSDELRDIIAGNAIEVAFPDESAFISWVDDAKLRQVLLLDLCLLG